MLHEVPFSYGICQNLKDFVQDDVRHSFSHESAEANAQIFRVLRPWKVQPSQHMQRQNNPCWWYEAQKIDLFWETDLASQLDGPIDLVLWLDWLWHVWIFEDILSGVREGSLQLPHQQCESAFSLAEGFPTMMSMKIRYAGLAGSALLWLSKDLFVRNSSGIFISSAPDIEQRAILDSSSRNDVSGVVFMQKWDVQATKRPTTARPGSKLVIFWPIGLLPSGYFVQAQSITSHSSWSVSVLAKVFTTKNWHPGNVGCFLDGFGLSKRTVSFFGATLKSSIVLVSTFFPCAHEFSLSSSSSGSCGSSSLKTSRA